MMGGVSTTGTLPRCSTRLCPVGVGACCADGVESNRCCVQECWGREKEGRVPGLRVHVIKVLPRRRVEGKGRNWTRSPCVALRKLHGALDGGAVWCVYGAPQLRLESEEKRKAVSHKDFVPADTRSKLAFEDTFGSKVCAWKGCRRLMGKGRGVGG